MSEAAAGGEAASLSCSHISNGDSGEQGELPFKLSGSQQKTAHAIRLNIERMIEEAGTGATPEERMADGLRFIGFWTLTVGNETEIGFEQVWDAKEASRRVNSLNSKVLPSMFVRAVLVTERHKSGAIHFHIVGQLREDIRTGFDFEAFMLARQFRKAGRPSPSMEKRYAESASPALRSLWAMMRETLPGYGFGRAELTPIRKSGEAIACYVSKYVSKNLSKRTQWPDDYRKKLVRYLGWNRQHLKPNDFSWATPGACLWRKRAENLAARADIFCRSDARKFFGPKWAYRFSQIMEAPVHQHGSWLEIAMQRHLADQTEERLSRVMTEEESEECEMLEAWHGGVTWMDLKREEAA